MSYSDEILKKQKYHEKTLSDSAVYVTYLRNLDAYPIFSSYAWMQLSAFDLSELGLGLLYSILPVDYQPVSVDFTYVTPTPSETLQGIWANFEPVRFEKMYTWMADMKEYIIENFKEEFQPEILVGIMPKAIYGVTPYGAGVYDPVAAREFLRATFHKLRLMRKPDVSWLSTMQSIVEYLEMIGVTDEHVFNRLTLIFSAQRYAFVLGLSLLGKSNLTETENGYGVIPFVDAKGNVYNVKFRTLDHLQMGFILGVTPLGYGLLLPKESIYKLPEGKKNPPIIEVMVEKIRGIINRLTLSTWSYSNYNKAEEMMNYHRSERTNQYDYLQTQRAMVESWVAGRIPKEEINPVRLRQYQNAVLQAICFRAKRHKWGFGGWKAMTEKQFKEWWISNWSNQGLTGEVLSKLYDDMSAWLQPFRDSKLYAGEKIRQIRRRLALLG